MRRSSPLSAREQRGQPHLRDETGVAVDLDDPACPSLATLVAAQEGWRSQMHAGEVILELEGETRILRTET